MAHRRVRIDGDPETYDVICETDTTKVLVNRDARLRLEVEQLEVRLHALREQLQARTTPRADLNGTPITEP